jgi:hypothetical protein
MASFKIGQVSHFPIFSHSVSLNTSLMQWHGHYRLWTNGKRTFGATNWSYFNVANTDSIPQFLSVTIILSARDSIVGWGTMLQAGKLRVRVPMRWIFFFNLPNPSSRSMALWLTQPLTEIITRNFLGVKGGRRVRLITLSPSVSHLSRASTSHNPMGLHSLLQG